jgi:hypothetical protein
MTVSKITDHVAQALGLLKSQYGDSTNMQAVVTALVEQVQDIEDDLYTMITSAVIAAAVGVQLDRIGEWVGQPRWDRNDADYRDLLGARVLVNSSDGTIEDIIAALVAMGATSVLYRYQDTARYSLGLTVVGVLSAADGDAYRQLLDTASPSGVAYLLRITDSVPSPAFQLDTPGSGWGDGYFNTRDV